ncbi:hypothetical protein CPB84DRAFT_1754066 [Gymnopilus junonius]|uniref:Uncharacterized protein n=1 Tax=Gymnopilus junonius TaxID=109634 RepID=A0A9P5TES4_GYMJU|nr:hypothetical protein CPB84DRAFT_1754066 [Gymnopilus junonius]
MTTTIFPLSTMHCPSLRQGCGLIVEGLALGYQKRGPLKREADQILMAVWPANSASLTSKSELEVKLPYQAPRASTSARNPLRSAASMPLATKINKRVQVDDELAGTPSTN